MIDRKIRKQIFVSIMITICMQVLFLLYLAKMVDVVHWNLVGGILLFIWGILSLFILYSVRRTSFGERKFLFWGILVNPCLLFIFTSIAAISRVYSQMEAIFLAAGIGIALCVVVGGVLLIFAIVKKEVSKR